MPSASYPMMASGLPYPMPLDIKPVGSGSYPISISMDIGPVSINPIVINPNIGRGRLNRTIDFYISWLFFYIARRAGMKIIANTG